MEVKEKNPFVPDVRFELIPIKALVSNQDYQRLLSQQHVTKTVKNFDIRQVNPVKVSRRNGINYVFNGQHTIETVAAVSGSRDTPVWCMVYDDMDYLEEADTFANQQRFVRQLTPYDIFKANIEAQNNEQLTIKELVESYNLKIGPTKGYCVICAISTLQFIYEHYGFHVLDRTLKLCVGTWEGEASSLAAGILKGIAMMVVAYQDKLKDALFQSKLGCVSVKEINRTAKERNNGAMGYAEALYTFYTKKMKYPPKLSTLQNVKKIAKGQRPVIDDTESVENAEFLEGQDILIDDEPEETGSAQNEENLTDE